MQDSSLKIVTSNEKGIQFDILNFLMNLIHEHSLRQNGKKCLLVQLSSITETKTRAVC